MAQSRKAENARKRRIWKKHLKGWQASGRTQVDYCREHVLCRHQFQYWKKRLHPPESPAFIELRVTPENEKQPTPLRLMVGDCQVAVERDFDPVALQQLIGVLSRL